MRVAIVSTIAFALAGGCVFDTGVRPAGEDADPDAPVDVVDGDISLPFNDNLVARYFADEASEGLADRALTDAAPDPLDLTIAAAGDVSFVERGGHRGLDWPTPGSTDTVVAPAVGTKVELELNGNTALTFEVVVEVEQLNIQGARFLHIGNDETGFGCVSFRTHGGSIDEPQRNLHLVFNGTRADNWPINVEGMGRIVMHLVVDTTAAGARDRAQLYIDGVAAEPGLGENVPQDGAFQVITNCGFLSAGNRPDGGRGSRMTLYYAALYAEAMTAGDVAGNAAALAVSDDR